jgi:hypothetical protein
MNPRDNGRPNLRREHLAKCYVDFSWPVRLATAMTRSTGDGVGEWRAFPVSRKILHERLTCRRCAVINRLKSNRPRKHSMKLRHRKLLILLTTIALLSHLTPSNADLVSAHQTALAAVPPPELPAKAAQIVKLEQEKSHKPTTVAVVRAATAVNPAAILSVVGAISRSVPAMAPVAAATAAEEQPRLAWAFSRTAALAAPEQAGEIVFAVASAVPGEARAVATAVALAAPESADAAIAALGRALPSMQPYLAEAKLLTENRDVSPSSIIALAAKLSAAAPVSVTDPMPEVSPPGVPVAAPKMGPPFVNPPGNPGHVIPGPPFTVPPGWQRKYSKPGPP